MRTEEGRMEGVRTEEGSKERGGETKEKVTSLESMQTKQTRQTRLGLTNSYPE